MIALNRQYIMWNIVLHVKDILQHWMCVHDYGLACDIFALFDSDMHVS